MASLLLSYIAGSDKLDEEGNVIAELKKHGILRALSIIPAVAAVILFVLTENMALPMTFIDKYTIMHLAIAVITLILAIFSTKRYEEA
jgi:hypothetical protein